MLEHEVMLFGGLGNQLFQMAFGRYLGAVSERVVRFTALGPVSTADLESLAGVAVARRPRGFNPLGAFRLPHRLAQRAAGRRERVDMRMSPWVAPGQAVEAACWCGYWQDPRYAASSEEWVAGLMGRVRHRLVAPIADRPFVALHVRRGDYVGRVPVLTVDYYRRAFDAVCRARDLEPTTTAALLVSNDPTWARANISLPASDVRATSGTAADDIAALGRAAGLVLSHSTFSWWAARLSDSATVVAAPRPWRLGPNSTDDGAVLRLPGWLEVDASYHV